MDQLANTVGIMAAIIYSSANPQLQSVTLEDAAAQAIKLYEVVGTLILQDAERTK